MKLIFKFTGYIKQEYLYYLDRLHWFKTQHFNIAFRKLQFMAFKQNIIFNMKRVLNKWV